MKMHELGEAVWKAYQKEKFEKWNPSDEGCIKCAVVVALRDVGRAPFELLRGEQDALERIKRVLGSHYADVTRLEQAFDRAQRTLVPKLAEQAPKAEEHAPEQGKAARIVYFEHLCARADERIAELEAKLSRVDAWLAVWEEEDNTWDHLSQDELCRQLRAAIAAAGVPAQPINEPRAGEDLAQVEPDPEAPRDIALLQSYWDARRAREGKPDRSRCGADLRQALASVEPLSDELRQDATALHSVWGDDPGSRIGRVAAELLRRCPKPEPLEQTPDDLERIIRNEAHLGSDSPEFNEALSKLVTLAVLAAEKGGAR